MMVHRGPLIGELTNKQPYSYYQRLQVHEE